MIKFKLILFVIFSLNICTVVPVISDKRLCANQNCTELISLAKTLIRYSSPDHRILSFAPNVEVKVFSKSAGSNMDLWGVEINGRRGYVSKGLIRETKILTKEFPHLVDTEVAYKIDNKEVPSNNTEANENVVPNRVQEQYEVVDGTTIFLNSDEPIAPSNADGTIQPTVISQLNDELNLDEVELAQVNKETESLEFRPVEVIDDNEYDDDEDDGDDDEEDEETVGHVTSDANDKIEANHSDKTGTENAFIQSESLIKDTIKTRNLLNVGDVSDSSANAVGIDAIVVQEQAIPESGQSEVENAISEATDSTSDAGVLSNSVATPLEDVNTEATVNVEAVVLNNSETVAPEVDITTESTVPFAVTEEVQSEAANVDTEAIVLNDSEVGNIDTEATGLNLEPDIISDFVALPQIVDEEATDLKFVVETDVKIEETDLNLKTEPQEQTAEHELSEQSAEILSTESPFYEAAPPLDSEVEVTPNPFENDNDVVEPSETDDVQSDEEKVEDVEAIMNNDEDEHNDSGMLSGIYSKLFRDSAEKHDIQNDGAEDDRQSRSEDVFSSSTNQDEVNEEVGNVLVSKDSQDHESCFADKTDCPQEDPIVFEEPQRFEEPIDDEPEIMMNSHVPDVLNLLIVLSVTGISVVLFLLGYVTIDKSRKEGPLIAKINTLEKALLVATKENQLLTDQIGDAVIVEENDGRITSESYQALMLQLEEAISFRNALEAQVESLEKELESSTEVGLELNRMLSDILSSQNGSDTLIANVEQLQRQLVEQQSAINSANTTMNLRDTENHELQLELEINNKKVTELQAELDKMVLNILKVEEEKEQLQSDLVSANEKLRDLASSSDNEQRKLLEEIKLLKNNCTDAQRNLELKSNEYSVLKDSVNQVKAIKNNTDTLKSLLDVSSVKAELQQLQRDNHVLSEHLEQEQQTKYAFEKQAELAIQETQRLKAKYDDVDKAKLEAQTKLEVLSNYFKDREAQLQKELSKQESMWVERQGEATSTIERIRYMQEELQNYKAQNESLKQEIVSQEVELKSQISVLEKKAHESWVTARQAERKLEDARQESAQLRNRLTLKERNYIDDKAQKQHNGELPTSPLHLSAESPASPPLLYGSTTSPGLPPFLPPPPGIPFMPPPMPGVPNFLPPPPSLFPVDHRPPPLGRMSSPPINSRYSPDSRYSPYDRNSPSPPYDDDYGSSPPPPLHRGYSPYNNRDDRRDYKRPPPPPLRSNGRHKGAVSSGSGNSNESLEKITRHHSKV